jgi:hypothetical protein
MWPIKHLVLSASLPLVLGLPAIAGEPATKPSHEPGTQEYMRVEGRRLIKAEQWQQAADLFGIDYIRLKKTVSAEWRDAQAKPQAERDRYRFALANFLFRYMNFMSGGRGCAAGNVLAYAEEYQQIVARLPAEEAQGALDFSHLDLLHSIGPRYRDFQPGPQEFRARVTEAVKSDPNSVPAIVALILLVTTVEDGKPVVSWEAAHQLATSPWARLSLARAAAASHNVPLRMRLLITERGWRLAPTKEEKAMLLYCRAESIAGSSQSRSYKTVEATLDAVRPIYRQFPTTQFAGNARRLAVTVLAGADRTEEALALVRELQSLGAEHRGGLDRALFQLSQAHFRRKQFEQSESLLREVIRDYADTPVASRAMLGLSEVLAARKDAVQERIWLLRCAQLEHTDPTNRDLMDTDNTRSVAMQRLATGYERDGQWAEALRWWTQWSPRSWCGTCAVAMQARRHRRLALCYLHLGEHEAAVDELFLAFEDGSMDESPNCAVLLFDVYERAKQVGDLMAIADAMDTLRERELLKSKYYQKMPPEELRKHLPTWPLRRLKQIADLGRAQDVAALQAMCLERHGDYHAELANLESGWEHRAAAATLAECGDAAVDSIRETLEGKDDLRQYRWLLCALGKSPSPAAMPLLEELGDRKLPYYRDLVQAIALRGEPGMAVVRRWFYDDSRSRSAAAEYFIEKTPTTRVAVESWPAPSQGSLPKTLPDSGKRRTKAGPVATETTRTTGTPMGYWWVAAMFVVAVMVAGSSVFCRWLSSCAHSGEPWV